VSRNGRSRASGIASDRQTDALAVPSIPAAMRERITAALARRATRERLMLALLLYERLTPGETAGALGLSVAEVCRVYDALLAELRRALLPPASNGSPETGYARKRVGPAAAPRRSASSDRPSRIA
jgi:DNA-directed RNA polymerase specialized sigma24 family protein